MFFQLQITAQKNNHNVTVSSYLKILKTQRCTVYDKEFFKFLGFNIGLCLN